MKVARSKRISNQTEKEEQPARKKGRVTSEDVEMEDLQEWKANCADYLGEVQCVSDGTCKWLPHIENRQAARCTKKAPIELGFMPFLIGEYVDPETKKELKATSKPFYRRVSWDEFIIDRTKMPKDLSNVSQNRLVKIKKIINMNNSNDLKYFPNLEYLEFGQNFN